MPLHWVFNVQGSVIPSVVASVWFYVQVAYCLARTQACSTYAVYMSIQLSNNVVAIHLDNNIATAFICNQGCTASLPLSRLVYHILNLGGKHGMALSTIHPHPSQCGTDYPSQGWLVLKWHLFLHVAQLNIIFWVIGRFVGIPTHPVNFCAFTPWKVPYLRKHWGWMLATILGLIRWFKFFSSCISSTSSVQGSGRTYH